MPNPHALCRNAALAILTLLAGCSAGDGADLILHNGQVLTVNAQDQVAEAIAVRDGLVLAVGSEAQIMALKDEHTEVIDLQGNTVLPGFIAAHEHPTLSAVFGGAADLSGFTHPSNAEVWAALKAAVAEADPGEWVYAGGIDPILTPDLAVPMRQALDAIAPDNPVLLVSQTLHSFWANSRAFAEAGIDRNTPDPGDGSYYQRDSQGELTGFIAESRAAQPLLKDLKSPWQLFGRYQTVLDDLLANGFTSVASLGYNVPPLMARFVASDHLQPRIRQFFYLVEDELKYLPDSPEQDNPYFRVLGIKLWHDGSPYTGSMFTSSPYLNSPLGQTLGIAPGSHGEAMFSQQQLQEKIRRYTAAGWQVAIHSQGDASARAVTQALKAAGPLPGKRPVVRLEHGVELPLDRLPLLAEMGVTPSFHINHILYYGDALEDSIIGRLMAQQVLPVRSAFAQHMRPTLHADSPMFPASPFSLMHTAITRQSSSGRALNAGEAIDIHQALRAMTVNGAYQLRIEEQAGSLEPGKWADLQIVDHNPYSVATEALPRIKVQAVYLAGERKYPR
ncbi:amidohydrolase [Pseudomonas sp. BMS12]|uniref:amidohydrolase n=1 Tax=Pseudomonas sp. BMS12 TaxID=1796033 RepID=UPI00083ADF7A|nr:amidohydrolase [Pseudomonas sp. BMS12]